LEKVYVPREDFAKHRRNVRFALAGLAGSTVLFLGLVVLAAVAFFRFGDLVETNDERISANRDLIDQIQECITPTPENSTDIHECYARGEDGQKAAVDRLLAGIAAGDAEILAAIRDSP
jgi:hypothetical protein